MTRAHVLALLLIGLSPCARAATLCTATATDVAFGPVSLTGPTDVQATFNVTCNTFGLSLLANAKARVCLNIDQGLSGGGNYNPRRMLNGFSDALQFQLYTDPARSQVWGTRGNATVPNPLAIDFDYAVPVLGGTQTQIATIYGRIPTQTLVAGNFANVFSGVQTSLDFRYSEVLLGNASFPASCTSGGTGGGTVSGAFPFTASANVPANCRAYAATELDFGTVSGIIDTNIDRSSSFAMTCTGRTAWQVGFDNGSHADGSTRRMRLGSTGEHIRYELYSTSDRLTRWGNTLNTDTRTGSGTGGVQTLTVYGRVPAPQAAAPGPYSDTITVTVTY